MTSNELMRERVILEHLRGKYEKLGFKFVAEPRADIVPPFLGTYRPDGIAFGADRNIIVEVKTHQNHTSDLRISEIAEKVAAQKGWDFIVIYADNLPDETVEVKPPTLEQITEALREAEQAFAQGSPRTAFLLAWVVLEALARSLDTRGDPEPKRMYSPVQAVQRLAMDGYITSEVAKWLRDRAKLRNSFMHGDFSVEITREDAENILGLIRDVAAMMQHSSKD